LLASVVNRDYETGQRSNVSLNVYKWQDYADNFRLRTLAVSCHFATVKKCSIPLAFSATNSDARQSQSKYHHDLEKEQSEVLLACVRPSARKNFALTELNNKTSSLVALELDPAKS